MMEEGEGKQVCPGTDARQQTSLSRHMSAASSASSLPVTDRPLWEELLPKLRPFQREAVDFGTQGTIYGRQCRTGTTDGSCHEDEEPLPPPDGRLLLADEMGLGKTVTALALAAFYQDEWPLLILCPASLKYTWPAELEKFCPSLPAAAVHVVAGFNDVSFVPRLGRNLSTDIVVVVMTYSLFQQRSAVAHALTTGNNNNNNNNKPLFNVVIADESHNLKERSSQRAQFVLPLLQQARRLFLLSGTPALARPVELWTQVAAVQPALFGTFAAFTKEYCNPRKKSIGRGRFIMDYGGSTNEAGLHAKLRRIMVRRLKADVLSELPPKQRRVVPVTMATATKAACIAAMQALAAQSNKGDKDDAASSSFQQNNALMKAFQTTGLGKAAAVADYLLEFLAGSTTQKILVFGHHKGVLDHVETALRRHYRKTKVHMRIDGSVPAGARASLVRQFQTNSKIRVGLLSMTAAGVGLTLTAASTVLFAELHWTPGVLAQAEDRAHRIGSTASSIQIVYMICRDATVSLDPTLWRLLGRKIGTLGQIVDGTRERPYLHRAEEEATAVTAPRQSVQEEVSAFFASEPDDRTASKPNIVIKGTIESFFKPAAPKSMEKAARASTLASASAARPKQSILSHAVPQHSRKRICLGTSKPFRKDSNNSRVKWSCATCTFYNSRLRRSVAYYTCEMCSDAYIPEANGAPESDDAATEATLHPSTFGGPWSPKIPVVVSAEKWASGRSSIESDAIVMDIKDDEVAEDESSNTITPTKAVVEIPDDGVIEENLVSAKDDDHKVDHVLEFSVSPNSGRISIYYARGKEASKINFDVNDVIAAETTDRLLAVSSQRRSDQRLEASSIAFNTTGVQDVLGCLKDSDMPDSRSRYEQDLRSFVSVYLTLSEAGRKVIKDAGSPFPPYNLAQRTQSPRLGSEIRSLNRYVGGAKERAVENREAGCPSSGDLAVLDGQACAWCRGDLPTAHQRAGAGYCSQACAEEGRLKRGGKYASGNLRSAVFAVEGGVCTLCFVGAHDLYQQILALHPAERLNKLLTAGWRLPNSAKALENLLQDPKEGDFWQADHIRAVAEGGGGCGLENLRTLCVPCHQGETEKLRIRLRLQGTTTDEDADNGAPMSGQKKRKQLDIRYSLFGGRGRQRTPG
jgi:SWI/SNF-related matrix-associated actin-dependent regulator 1 of chromatin subfamily A